jgi:uncharacterized protein
MSDRDRARAALLAVLLVTGGAMPLRAQGFVLLHGADTVAVERVQRSAGRLDGELQLRFPAAVSVRYQGSPGTDALLPSLSLETAMAGTNTAINVTFQGDSAFVEVGPMTQRIQTAVGALPFANPSAGMIEQIAMRARVLGGERVEIPIFNLSGGQTVNVTVQRVGVDSLSLSFPPGIEIRARVDAEGRLLGATVPSQGLEIRRTDAPIAMLAPAPPPDYSAPPGAPYRAEEVRVEVPAGHVLAGTLTIPTWPSGRLPAVVLISGSGAQDRDESLPQPAGYRIFREIADTLSRRGIAVLRLDDPGVGGSTGSAAGATTASFADDVRAALEYLRKRADIDPGRLGLVGHSEGGIIAPMVAADGPALRAIVLMAGSSRVGRKVLEYQLRRSVEADATLSPARRDSALARLPATIESLAANPWMRYFLDYDPIPVLRRVKVPVLVLQGGTDRQVTADQAEEIAAALRASGNERVTVRTFPGVNHLFLHDRSGDPQGYGALAPPVADEVVGTLADWLGREL